MPSRSAEGVSACPFFPLPFLLFGVGVDAAESSSARAVAAVFFFGFFFLFFFFLAATGAASASSSSDSGSGFSAPSSCWSDLLVVL